MDDLPDDAAPSGVTCSRLLMARRSSFFIALLLVAACLRSPITGVGPLLDTISEALSLTATQAGVLSSLPLLMFAGCAPVARLARAHGTERLLFASLVVAVGGILLRSEGSTTPLFAGTVLLSSGIAVANILMPIVVKQHYPERIASITTAYASVMGGFAALASGVSAPLARLLPGGWQWSLASWSVLAALALVLWLPQLRAPTRAAAMAEPAAHGLPWRSSIAWQVTGFMGLQSTVFYVTISWYPTMLVDSGMPVETTGWLLTLYQVAALVAGLAVPALIRRYRDQRRFGLVCGLITAVATLGVLLAPRAALLWLLLMGLGSGPALILALSFMGLRAATSQSAAALSLMAQAMGYLVAAFGPVIFGAVHDFTHGWTWPMLFTVAVALGMAACGWGAGRPVKC